MNNNAKYNAKKKYDNEHYSSLQVFLDKDLVSQFKETVRSSDLNQTDVIRYLVIDFIINNKKYLSDEKVLNAIKQKSDIYELIKNSQIDRCESQIENLKQCKTSSEILKELLGDYGYQKKDLLPIAEYLDLNINKKSLTTDIIIELHHYFSSKLKN